MTAGGQPGRKGLPRRRVLLGAGAAGLSLALPAGVSSQGLGAGLPRRGVNLSHWFSWEGRQPVAASDLRLIRAAGFDHVRLPVDPEFLGWAPPDPGLPPQLARLDAALALILDAGLAVIVSFHAREQTRDQIELRRPYQDAFIAYWQGLARRYAALSGDRVIFAVMNEPQYYVRGAARWHELQQRVVRTIRAEHPRRMLALSGVGGSGIDYIERSGVIRDPDSFFVFHFYEPYLVSHFGASWEPFTSEPGALVGHVVYPSPQMTMAAAAIRYGPQFAAAEKLVRAYIDRPWTAETIDRRVAVAAAWARRSGVRMMCTEFGVLRIRIDSASRYRWLGDVRTALEHYGIGWSVWDYADLFGIATARGAVDYLADGAVVPRDPANPNRAFDPGVLAALGL